MIPDLAKMSVKRKMDFKASKLLGAYEYFYAAGFLCGYMDLSASDILDGNAHKDLIRDNSAAITSAKEDILYLYDEFLKCQVPNIEKNEDKDVLIGLFNDGLSDGEKRK